MSALKPVLDQAYPFWPPGLPRPADSALRTTVGSLIAELPVNQSPSGRNTEIPIVQKPMPRQARATGPGMNEERGHYGSDLYDAFMAPYEPKSGGAE